MLRSTNFRNDGSIDFTDLAFRKIDKTRLEKRQVKQGSILIEKSGGSPTQAAGRVVYCDRDFGGTASNFIEIVQVNNDFYPQYVALLLFYMYQIGLVLKYQQQTTGIINFKLGQYVEELVSLPTDKREQTKIAEVLSTVNRAIEQTEALIAKQQRIKTGLMQDLLTKGIDAHGNIRSEATHAFKDSPLGRIPVEWTPSSLGKVYSELPRNGIYKPAAQIGAGVILVGQTSFTEERLIDYTQTRRVQVSDSETRAYGLRAGDILVSRVFATIEGVGLPTFVHEVPEIAVYESNMLRFRINRELAYPLFINYWLLSESVRRTIVSSVNASNQVSINQQALADLPLPLPPLEEQELILACLEDARATQKANKSSLVKALAVKVGLANDLLTGKRRVTPLLAAETSQPDV